MLFQPFQTGRIETARKFPHALESEKKTLGHSLVHQLARSLAPLTRSLPPHGLLRLDSHWHFHQQHAVKKIPKILMFSEEKNNPLHPTTPLDPPLLFPLLLL